MTMKPYSHARWHLYREEVIKLDGGRCVRCRRGRADGAVLQAHHKAYVSGRMPWDSFRDGSYRLKIDNTQGRLEYPTVLDAKIRAFEFIESGEAARFLADRRATLGERKIEEHCPHARSHD
jgi:hypothetical protein